MVNQTLGGVSPIDFISSNFQGAFKINRLDEINPGLGKALMVIRRGSMLDMPDIGGVAGMDQRADSSVGILVKMGAPTPPAGRDCTNCKKVESMPYCLPGHYCNGDESQYTSEEQLFRAIAKQHIPGRLTVVGGKRTDSTRYYLALGIVDDDFALDYKLVSVEMMYLYDSFPHGLQPETGLPTHKVYTANQVTAAVRAIDGTNVSAWRPENLQRLLDAITNVDNEEE